MKNKQSLESWRCRDRLQFVTIPKNHLTGSTSRDAPELCCLFVTPLGAFDCNSSQANRSTNYPHGHLARKAPINKPKRVKVPKLRRPRLALLKTLSSPAQLSWQCFFAAQLFSALSGRPRKTFGSESAMFASVRFGRGGGRMAESLRTVPSEAKNYLLQPIH